MHKQRKAILIAAAVGVIAMFLPWVSLGPYGSVNGLHGGGILVLLAFIGAGVAAFLNAQDRPLDKTMWAVALGCGALAAAILIINLLRALDALGYLSIGFWLALIASLAVLAAAWLLRDPSYNIQGGFDSLKDEVARRTGGLNNTGSSSGTGTTSGPSSSGSSSTGSSYTSPGVSQTGGTASGAAAGGIGGAVSSGMAANSTNTMGGTTGSSLASDVAAGASALSPGGGMHGTDLDRQRTDGTISEEEYQRRRGSSSAGEPGPLL